MENISGTIQSFLYQNSDNGYCVLRLTNNTVATGTLIGVNIGDSIDLEGEFVFHQRYGKQFKFTTFSQNYPNNKVGIVKYLSSGLIRGIGLSTAHKIYSQFGLETISVMDKDIARLKEIDGIGEKKFEIIKKSWESQNAIKNIMIFLQGHKITTGLALKIYNQYKENAINVVKDDPYRLTYDIWGIGFKTADSIGKNLGFDDSHPARIRAGLVYLLNEAAGSGHTYLPKVILLESAQELLTNSEIIVSDALKDLIDELKILDIDNNIFLPQFYYSERGSETKLKKIVEQKRKIHLQFDKLLNIATTIYSEEQLIAIETAFNEKVMILTGGPGTGKTTVLKGIIDIYKKLDLKIKLAAPTGRAAKRMTQVIGLESKTIHRLLEFDPLSGIFVKDEDNPIEADIIVIDEMSMVDSLLFYQLLKAINPSTSVVFVGDPDQLPSVGAGNVLTDLINSGKFPVITLTKIFRQAEQSRIVTNSHAINSGKMPDLKISKDGDFFFIEENSPLNIPALISSLCKDRLPDKYGFHPVKDIQVLSPMHKGEAGVANLNLTLQEMLNHNEIIYNKMGKIFKKNDKVMQIKNNYELDVFNGDIGFVSNVNNEEQKIYVLFDDKEVKYDFAILDELITAYAITVHKSQGSEYDCIILTLLTDHYMMLQRNLLYTAVTRAKKILVLIGSRKAIEIAVKNKKVQERFTSLYQMESMKS